MPYTSSIVLMLHDRLIAAQAEIKALEDERETQP